MRILAVIPDPDLPETHLLHGVSHSAELAVISSESSPRWHALRDLPFVRSSRFKNRIDGQACHDIQAAIKEFRPEIIHCFSSRGLSTTLRASRGLAIPIVVYRGTMGRVSRFDPASWMSYLNPRVSGYICVSEATRQYLLRFGIPPHKVRTIYKGHRLEWYEQSPVPLAAVGIPEKTFVIACVANARPVKGVDILVRAFAELPPQAHLLLIGELRDGRVRRLIARSAARDRIHAVGYRTDAPGLVCGASVFAMPSRAREGLPKAAIEAMALGVPPVVSAVGGMPELVLHEECGLVVAPGDPSALAQAVRRLMDDAGLAARLGAAARERIKRHFRIECTIDETLAFYRDLIAR